MYCIKVFKRLHLTMATYKTIEVTSGALGRWTVTTRRASGERVAINIVVPVGKEFEYKSPSRAHAVELETGDVVVIPLLFTASVQLPEGFREATQCDFDRFCAKNPVNDTIYDGNAEVWRRMAGV